VIREQPLAASSLDSLTTIPRETAMIRIQKAFVSYELEKRREMNRWMMKKIIQR